MFSIQEAQNILRDNDEDRQIALEYIAEAWNAAEAEGIDSESLSHAALFASMATLVRLFGEDVTAKLVADLPKKIESGEYSIDRIIQ